MRKELDDLLISKYPLLHANRYKAYGVTCMCWGFECGDGWFDIIDEAELESENTCELCGKPGTMRNTGWINVRCEDCKR